MNEVGSPKENYGFLIWEADNEDIAYYRATIRKTTITESDTTTEVAYRSEVWDRSFLKIPHKYTTTDEAQAGVTYQLELTGFDDSHNPVNDETIVNDRLEGGGGGEIGCYWECVSSEYAYRIQQYTTPQGLKNYGLSRAYETWDDDLNVAVPYYQFFGASDFHDYVQAGSGSTGNPHWHNFWGWTAVTDFTHDPNVAVSEWPTYVVKYTGVNEGQYVDGYGHDITSSTVYGLRKGYGPWFYPDLIEAFEVLGGPDFCEGSTVDLNHMINYFNQQVDHMDPTLICAAFNDGSTNPNPWPGPPNFGGLDYIKIMWKKWGVSGGKSSGESDSSGNVDDEILFVDEDTWVERVEGVFGGDGSESGGSSFTDILSTSEMFNLVRYRNGAEEVISGDKSTFLDANDTPVFPTIDFEEGLYKLTVKREEMPLFYVIFEVREPFSASVELKEYFDALMFPNPHTGNVINANITTSAALHVNYELFDAMGNLLFDKNFQVSKDHNSDHQVDTEVYLPEGFLYHKFTFADGSFKTYTTIKQ